MRRTSLAILFAACALTGSAAVSNAAPPAEKCSDLTAERSYLVLEAKRLTSAVEAKNAELGDAADSLSAAKNAQRKTELERRAEGLRRELTVLLDRELETTNRLGYLDSTISKRCAKGGGK